MITIPIAVANDWFKKQIYFFQYQHLEVYGEDAVNKAIIPIVNKNHPNEHIKDSVDWDMKLPYKMVDSILDMYDLKDDWFIPTNVFTAAKQVIMDLPDEQVVEIVDSDLVHIKKYTGPYPEYNQVIADAHYEDWHLKTSTRESENFYVIEKYLKHNDFKYMNGGFNVIARVGTLRVIIDEIIEVSINIGKEYERDLCSWWQAMYGLNVACHNNRVTMIDGKNCYYPSINQLEDNHHIAHYCCDSLFNKRDMNNLQSDKFPDNIFYNQAKKWLESV